MSFNHKKNILRGSNQSSSVIPATQNTQETDLTPTLTDKQQQQLITSLTNFFLAKDDIITASKFRTEAKDLVEQAKVTQEAKATLDNIRESWPDVKLLNKKIIDAKIQVQKATSLYNKAYKSIADKAGYQNAGFTDADVQQLKSFQNTIDSREAELNNYIGLLDDIGNDQVDYDAQAESLKIGLIDIGHPGENPDDISLLAVSNYQKAIQNEKDSINKAVNLAISMVGQEPVAIFAGYTGFSPDLKFIAADSHDIFLPASKQRAGKGDAEYAATMSAFLSGSRIVAALQAGSTLALESAQASAQAISQAKKIQSIADNDLIDMTSLSGDSAKLPESGDLTPEDAQTFSIRYQIILLGKEIIDLDLATNRSTDRANNFADNANAKITEVLAFSDKNKGALTSSANDNLQKAVDILKQVGLDSFEISKNVVLHGKNIKDNLLASGIGGAAVQDSGGWNMSTISNNEGTGLPNDVILQIDPNANNVNTNTGNNTETKKSIPIGIWISVLGLAAKAWL